MEGRKTDGEIEKVKAGKKRVIMNGKRTMGIIVYEEKRKSI